MDKMRSSGLFFERHPDGSASLGYEDYGVEIFDGADYEVTYLLDKENMAKLMSNLDTATGKNTRDLLIEKFGKEFHSMNFEEFCKDHEIVFKRNIHIG